MRKPEATALEALSAGTPAPYSNSGASRVDLHVAWGRGEAGQAGGGLLPLCGGYQSHRQRDKGPCIC